MIGVTIRRVVASEALKLATLRGTVLAYGAIAATLALMAAVVFTLPLGGTDEGGGDAILSLILFAELLVGITGVLAATGEYAAGTMRATLAAVPRRLPVLAAKLAVHAGLVAVLVLPATAAAFLAGQATAPDKIGAVTDPEVMRGLGGAALVFAATSALGLSIGTLTRSPGAAIGILFTIMILPLMITVAPEATAVLPARAAPAIMLTDNPAEAHFLGPVAASLVLLGWTAAAIAAAALALRRRDA